MSIPPETAPKSSPTTISMAMHRQWQIIRPRVYRFLPSQFVDKFFEDGSLRLSSLAKFAQHADEQRKDTAEGFGVRVGTGTHMMMASVHGRGVDCYVLCGSMHNTKNIAAAFPDCDSCIIIDNPLSFAAEVALEIPYFQNGFEGSCIYQDDTTIYKDIADQTPEQLMDKFRNPDGSVSTELLTHTAEQIGGIEEYFLKSSIYIGQSEYRFLWQSRHPVGEFIDIKAPGARRFCRKGQLP